MENYFILANSTWATHYENPPKFHPYWFEDVDINYWKDFMLKNDKLSWYSATSYLVFIFTLQALMKNRLPIIATNASIVWNASLAIFSLLGFCRMGQELFTNIWKEDGFYRSVCVREGKNLPADFWGLLFTFSKFVEFGDTVFIVLRKQPLLLLQYYHHAIVTIMVWALYPYGEPITTYFAVINFGVHSVMYAYFVARGMKIKVPQWVAMSITTLQILQMIVNTGINIYSVAIPYYGVPCNRHPTSIKFGLGVYISLWILFAKFFIERYSNNHKVSKKIQ